MVCVAPLQTPDEVSTFIKHFGLWGVGGVGWRDGGVMGGLNSGNALGLRER